MGIKERLLDWLWSKLKGRSPSDYKQMQEYYKAHIDFIKADYEERIKYIREEKKKHPENGLELEKHKETLNFYYRMTLKLNQENIDLREQLLFITKNKLP